MKKKNLVLIFILGLMLPIINVQAYTSTSCGNVTNIPVKVPQITSLVVSMVQILIPVILIIVGSIDLIKGVVAQKEDEIKKGQQKFIKRLITAAIIFFVIVLVKLIISLAADSDDTNNIIDCMDCFLYNKCG